MIILLPLELQEREKYRGLPLANSFLIALNVLSFALMRLFGWCWPVGPGTGIFSIVLYGFSHVGFWHLLFNMWALWVFGNPVNRRLGNVFYLLAYLGTILILGLVARICYFGPVVGASGGIFAVITIAAMLMPSALLVVAYGALFPLTLLIGLIRKPKYGIYWFICGGQFRLRALWCLVFIPLLIIVSMSWALWTGFGSAWNLGHLLGMVCGVVVVLLLPTRISMKKRSSMYSLGRD